MPVVKLHYFDGRGRGEMIRMALAAAGVPFEDIRYTFDTFKEFKPKTPTGQLPVLEVDGHMFYESHAILRHVARVHGLYGDSDMDATMVDTVLGLCEDIAIKIRPTLFEKDEAKLLTIADIVMHTTFEGYEDVLKSQSKALWEHRERVAGVDNIKKYLKDRPVRPM